MLPCNNGKTLTTPDQPASIDFDATPILLNNSLVINQGQTVPLTSTFLSATHPGGDDRILLFNISSVMHGKFSFTASLNNLILIFISKTSRIDWFNSVMIIRHKRRVI